MLWGRLDSVGRLMYDLAAGPKAPARLATGGRSVRLEGFTCRPANTLEVLGVDHKKVLLLVVAPSTDPDIAHEAIPTAAPPDNASTVGGVPGISAGPRTAGRVIPTGISPTCPEVSAMTVKVTLPGEGKDKYLRFGDVYVKHNDGRLDVCRVGAKPAYSYACGEWTDVEGDQKRVKRRGFWGDQRRQSFGETSFLRLACRLVGKPFVLGTATVDIFVCR